MKRRQAGAALMLVMWFVAALSIIALSLSAGARIDLRGTSQFVDMARVEALAQTASNLILLEFETDRAAFEQNFRREYQYDGHTLVAEIRPDGAFVNLNSAPRELLMATFLHAGGVVEDQVEDLVKVVMEWRSHSATDDSARVYENAGVAFRPRHGRFEAVEDLVQVLGVGYDTYAKIAAIFTVYGSKSSYHTSITLKEIPIIILFKPSSSYFRIIKVIPFPRYCSPTVISRHNS